MKGLLDTHAFLWWCTNDSQLSETAHAFISDGNNEIFLSAATVWEIAIKYRKGKLKLPEPPNKYVANRISKHQFTSLPIRITHAAHVQTMPDHHNDPFDHLLIAQCQIERMHLITVDREIQKYPIKIIW